MCLNLGANLASRASFNVQLELALESRRDHLTSSFPVTQNGAPVHMGDLFLTHFLTCTATGLGYLHLMGSTSPAQSWVLATDTCIYQRAEQYGMYEVFCLQKKCLPLFLYPVNLKY